MLPRAAVYAPQMLRIAALSIVATVLAGCGSSTSSEPPWVSTGVATLRSYFVGKPRPASVSWRHTRTSDWVSVTFSTIQTCTLCNGPSGSVVRGRRATITWQHGRHRITGITIEKHGVRR